MIWDEELLHYSRDDSKAAVSPKRPSQSGQKLMNFATLKLSAVCRQLDKSKKYLLCRLAGETLFPEHLFTASLKLWRALLESCKLSLSPACELLFISEVSWGASSLLQELYQYRGNCCAKTLSTAQERKENLVMGLERGSSLCARLLMPT